MKIEKVNDYQIRCTLTSDDLADRQIKLSELVYGSDKTKQLFRDMMQQASLQFGFEAEDIPLMIEAIPLNSGCLVLVITKVEDPEELDTRFSNFAPSIHDDEDDDDMSDDDGRMSAEGTSEVMDLFRKIKKAGIGEKNTAAASQNIQVAETTDEEVSDISILYRFASLTDLVRAAKVLSTSTKAATSLYKNAETGQYTLVVTKGSVTANEFNCLCNTISEYGKGERLSPNALAYLEEHYESLISSGALEALAQL